MQICQGCGKHTDRAGLDAGITNKHQTMSNDDHLVQLYDLGHKHIQWLQKLGSFRFRFHTYPHHYLGPFEMITDTVEDSQAPDGYLQAC